MKDVHIFCHSYKEIADFNPSREYNGACILLYFQG